MRDRVWLWAMCMVMAACASSGNGVVVVDPDAGADAGADVTLDRTTDLGPGDGGQVDAGGAADAAPGEAGTDAVAGDGASGCSSNGQCAGHPGGPVCDPRSGRCVACLPDNDGCPPGQYCDPPTLTCALGCRDDGACAAGQGDGGTGGASTRCDRATRQCVQCVTSAHCSPGNLCVGGVCVMGCTSGRPCPTGQSCCDGACVDASGNVAHCGACGARCSVPNASAACLNGRCAVGQCSVPFGDCDNDPANGCETDTHRTVAHCGACGRVCPARANALATCAAGLCGFQCMEGFADCDLDPSNGCEVDTRRSVSHCARCGAVCNPPNAAPTCVLGQCRVDFCADGFGNCDGNPTNGCEAVLSTSVAHCGACGRLCPSADNAFPGCLAGRCVTSCVMGFQDCDGDPANGCEADLRTSPAHCGACGRACAPRNGVGACATGRCTITRCDPGFADCDGNPDTGCETDTRASPAHCGMCGNLCTTSGGTPVCRAGVCGIGACAPGRGDCDGTEANGCETDTQSSPTHCGACGRACSLPSATAGCTGGRCVVSACNGGFADCDGAPDNGCETDIRTTPTACGACGRVCGLPNATAGCVGGQCSVAACGPGFADCDGNPVNGCEVDLRVSPLHCGACGTRCTSNVCREGACQVFGGAYETSDPPCASCHNANPLSGGCGCPAGFVPSGSFRTTNDCRGAGIQTGATVVTCAAGGPSDWAGAYQRDDNVPCGRGCRAANPYTGGCSCPAGTTGVEFRTLTDAPPCSGLLGSHIGMCLRTGGARPSFGGAYQVDDNVLGGIGCRTVNPATGACSCPSGFSAGPLRVQVDSSRGFIGAVVYVCTR